MPDTRPLNDAEKANFQTLLRAAESGHLALISAKDAKTGEHRALIAAVAEGDDGQFHVTPFGHLTPGNPFEEYADPTL